MPRMPRSMKRDSPAVAVVTVRNPHETNASVFEAADDLLLVDLIAGQTVEPFQDEHVELAGQGGRMHGCATGTSGHRHRAAGGLVGEDGCDGKPVGLSPVPAGARLILDRGPILFVGREAGVDGGERRLHGRVLLVPMIDRQCHWLRQPIPGLRPARRTRAADRRSDDRTTGSASGRPLALNTGVHVDCHRSATRTRARAVIGEAGRGGFGRTVRFDPALQLGQFDAHVSSDVMCPQLPGRDGAPQRARREAGDGASFGQRQVSWNDGFEVAP